MDLAVVALPVVAVCVPLCRLTLALLNTSGTHYCTLLIRVW